MTSLRLRNDWKTLFIALGLVASVGVIAGCSTGETVDDDSAEEAERPDDHGDHHDHSFEDPEEWAERWNDPERDEWQRPEAVVEAMEIEEGMTVADLGAGTGYFVPHLAEAVGEEGEVVAIDIEESMLEFIDDKVDEQGLDNVRTLLAEPDDTGLQPDSVDRILTVNTWHHIPDREEYSAHLAERLVDGGSVFNIDFHEDSPTGPPVEHRLDPEVVIAEMEAGGLDAEVVDVDLPRQYVVVGSAR